MNKFNPYIFMCAARREAGENSHSASLKDMPQLLKMEGEPFLHQAYAAFLGRAPDPAGMAAWLPASKKLLGRCRILISLWLSPERFYMPPWQRAILRALTRGKR